MIFIDITRPINLTCGITKADFCVLKLIIIVLWLLLCKQQFDNLLLCFIVSNLIYNFMRNRTELDGEWLNSKSC